jgi:hypothetical protein
MLKPMTPRPRLASLVLLTLALGAALLPEVGHSAAHRDGWQAAHHHPGEVELAQADGRPSVEDDHGARAHEHTDLIGTSSIKRVAITAGVVAAAVVLPVPAAPVRFLPHVMEVGSPRWLSHGPPPPSRAPPLS